MPSQGEDLQQSYVPILLETTPPHVFLSRIVESELFPALRYFGLRFYAYNPVSDLFSRLCVLVFLILLHTHSYSLPVGC